MLYKKCTDEELNHIIKTGNHMDMLVIEIENKAAQKDYDGVTLESKLIGDVDSLIYEGSEYKSSEEIDDHINCLYCHSRILYDVIKQIKEAQENDGSSDLKIMYKNTGDQCEK